VNVDTVVHRIISSKNFGGYYSESGTSQRCQHEVHSSNRPWSLPHRLDWALTRHHIDLLESPLLVGREAAVVIVLNHCTLDIANHHKANLIFGSVCFVQLCLDFSGRHCVARFAIDCDDSVCNLQAALH
jgi:hypothetical protein